MLARYCMRFLIVTISAIASGSDRPPHMLKFVELTISLASLRLWYSIAAGITACEIRFTRDTEISLTDPNEYLTGVRITLTHDSRWYHHNEHTNFSRKCPSGLCLWSCVTDSRRLACARHSCDSSFCHSPHHCQSLTQHCYHQHPLTFERVVTTSH